MYSLSIPAKFNLEPRRLDFIRSRYKNEIFRNSHLSIKTHDAAIEYLERPARRRKLLIISITFFNYVSVMSILFLHPNYVNKNTKFPSLLRKTHGRKMLGAREENSPTPPSRKILSRFSPKFSRTTGTAFSYYLDINLNSRKIISEFPEYFRAPLKKTPRSIDKGNIKKAF